MTQESMVRLYYNNRFTCRNILSFNDLMFSIDIL
uniref:Uncharacterized protein n=1 Tax=Podoviridae sp. ctZkC8 TaxID=2825259 RepID=A0A8S5UC15_9CAUD|nr:MAG TPA: hypothetical protein [Podoviridae sp. ctZkC8]